MNIPANFDRGQNESRYWSPKLNLTSCNISASISSEHVKEHENDRHVAVAAALAVAVAINVGAFVGM